MSNGLAPDDWARGLNFGFIYFPISLYVRGVNALAILCGCPGLSRPPCMLMQRVTNLTQLLYVLIKQNVCCGDSTFKYSAFG